MVLEYSAISRVGHSMLTHIRHGHTIFISIIQVEIIQELEQLDCAALILVRNPYKGVQ